MEYPNEISEEMAAKTINVKGKTYNVVLAFPVLHIGWEMDNVGYVAEDENNKKVLIISSHGGWFVAEDTSGLGEDIELYQHSLELTIKARQLMES